jgi:hypothetical protein
MLFVNYIVLLNNKKHTANFFWQIIVGGKVFVMCCGEIGVCNRWFLISVVPLPQKLNW